mmetsp:Transcript_11547/g.12689  ORF Transcript_11547/g.12689 Transcript_11547/m.12689 type:complete len:328 (-) Transcript_11547:136-1119(-)
MQPRVHNEYVYDEEQIEALPPDVLCQIGIDRVNKGRNKEAIRLLSAAVKRGAPNKPVILQWLGNAHRNLQDYQNAFEFYAKSLKLRPMDSLVWYNQGWILDELGRLEEAITCYDKAIAIDDGEATKSAWNNKGYVLRHLGRCGEAITCYDRAIALDPGDFNAWNNKGAALNVLNKPRMALKCLDKALMLKQNFANPWSHKGRALASIGKIDESFECLEKALTIDDKYANGYTNLGIVQRQIGNYEAALICFARAKVLKANSAEIEKQVNESHRLKLEGGLRRILLIYIVNKGERFKSKELNKTLPRDLVLAIKRTKWRLTYADRLSC